MTDLAIITVTYNAEPFIGDFISSLNKQTNQNFKVFFIDNNSKDRTLKVIHEKSSFNYEIKENSENLGIAEGNNIGINMAHDFDTVLLANNDTYFSNDTLHKMISAKSQHPDNKVFVTKVFNNEEPPKVWYSGGGFSIIKGNTGFHENLFSFDKPEFNKKKLTLYSPTCFMLVDRSVFSEIGLMDKKYFVYFDDTDFCWRLKKKKISILYLGDIEIYHKIGSSTGGVDSNFTIKFSSRNRVYFLKKSKGIFFTICYMPIFLFYYVFKYLKGSIDYRKLKIALNGLKDGFFY